jgi:hypothetical protein
MSDLGPVMNQDHEDEIYMQRRYAVAMEGLEEELEEGNIQPNNPFENGNDFIPLAPELEVVQAVVAAPAEQGNEELWDMPMPLERQNAIDPFRDAVEEDERRDEEWLRQNYELAKNPNSKWEAINHNHLWSQRVRHQWIYPSNKMMEVDKKATVIGYEFSEHQHNLRLLAPRDVIPTHFSNRFLGIHFQCTDCNCCERHQLKRPEFGEIVPEMAADHHLNYLHDGEKANNCICPCRHIMRSHNRLMNDQ